MYPEIIPDVRIETTISNPYDQAEVVGFVGRNKRLGREAIVMKEACATTEEVQIKMDVAKTLLEGDGELLFLTDDSVYAMDGEDFATQGGIKTIAVGVEGGKVGVVRRESDYFRVFDRDKVGVTN
jgi:hypothetical protein